MKTHYRIIIGDSRWMKEVPDESVQWRIRVHQGLPGGAAHAGCQDYRNLRGDIRSAEDGNCQFSSEIEFLFSLTIPSITKPTQDSR